MFCTESHNKLISANLTLSVSINSLPFQTDKLALNNYILPDYEEYLNENRDYGDYKEYRDYKDYRDYRDQVKHQNPPVRRVAPALVERQGGLLSGETVLPPSGHHWISSLDLGRFLPLLLALPVMAAASYYLGKPTENF